MSELDLSKQADFERWIDWVKSRAARNLARDGEVYPMAYFVITRNAESKALVEPAVMAVAGPKAFSSQEQKAGYAMCLRALAAQSHAIGYAFACGCFVARVDEEEIQGGANGRPNMELAEARVEKYIGRVQEMPGAKEICHLVVEHATYNGEARSHQANVVRSAKWARLASWTTGPGAIGGQFANILRDLELEPEWA